MKVERERLVGWSWLWGLSAGVLSLFGACGLLLHLLAFFLSGSNLWGSVLARRPHLPHFYAIVARWGLSGLRQVPHLIIHPLLSDKPYIFHGWVLCHVGKAPLWGWLSMKIFLKLLSPCLVSFPFIIILLAASLLSSFFSGLIVRWCSCSSFFFFRYISRQ